MCNLFIFKCFFTNQSEINRMIKLCWLLNYAEDFALHGNLLASSAPYWDRKIINVYCKEHFLYG